MENKYRLLLQEIFNALERGDYKEFFHHFSQDTVWIVEGTHPLAGKYQSLQEFRTATFDRLQHILESPLKFKVKEIIADEEKGAVILEATSVTHYGTPFHNRYCWVVFFSPNDKIDRVDAFLDTQLIVDIFAEETVRKRT